MASPPLLASGSLLARSARRNGTAQSRYGGMAEVTGIYFTSGFPVSEPARRQRGAGNPAPVAAGNEPAAIQAAIVHQLEPGSAGVQLTRFAIPSSIGWRWGAAGVSLSPRRRSGLGGNRFVDYADDASLGNGQCGRNRLRGEAYTKGTTATAPFLVQFWQSATAIRERS